MDEIREVRTYEDTTSGSSMVAIFIVAVVALLGIGLMFWQPWNPPTNTTEIVHTSSPAAPSTTVVNPPSNTTVVNPPASQPPAGKTDITIHNEGQSGSSNTGSTGTETSESSTGG